MDFPAGAAAPRRKSVRPGIATQIRERVWAPDEGMLHSHCTRVRGMHKHRASEA